MYHSIRALSLLSFSSAVLAVTHELIVGTFGTKVLYTLEFDDETLALELIANTSVPASGSSPAFISYSLESATSISYNATVAAGGNCTATAIFVVADPNPPYSVYGSFFGGNAGCGTVLAVNDDGALETSLQNYTYFESSSVHGTALSPNSRFLYSADDGGNTLWTHGIDSTTGELSFVANLSAPAVGDNPRHVTVHPDGGYLYVIFEEASQVAQYTIDTETGVPSYDSAYSLLPTDQSASEYWADEVALSFSKSYLWATNRGRTTNTTGFISAFSLDDSGRIMTQNFLLPTSSSGGAANSVAPSLFTDRFIALTDSSEGFVEIWELNTNGSSASVVAHLDLSDGGCCANAVWYS
ncbi:carboxy-cis,cis-muconate cyclase [Xylariales sp. PMI_506]|nr:carboxy-cis,cis-muconate cyclase [Xylariales sp. PMI_506]